MASIIWTKVTLPGWHRWPLAEGKRAYLAHRHRHLFHITAQITVSTRDREVEFHDLQDMITAWWDPEQRNASCETMAEDLAAYLAETEGLTVCSAEVSEDGESGAIFIPDLPGGAS